MKRAMLWYTIGVAVAVRGVVGVGSDVLGVTLLLLLGALSCVVAAARQSPVPVAPRPGSRSA